MHLPINRQIQIIADLLAGRKTGYADGLADETVFTVPWRDYAAWINAWLTEDPTNVDPKELQYEFWNDHSHYGEHKTESFELDYARIKRAIDHPFIYPTAPELLSAVSDLAWLWPNWLLRGLPSLLAAAPGTGKSYLALDLAQRIILANAWPDGVSITDGGSVLYVDAENTPTIMKERVKTWGDELRQLYIMLPAEGQFLINLDGWEDQDRLRDMAYVIRPRLVIVDSYGSSTIKGENNKEDVQQLLAFFTDLAREFDCGLLIIHHLRKGGSGQLQFTPITMDDIRGSSHIVAMARHILALQFCPTGPESTGRDPRRLWVLKSNVGPPPNPLGVEFNPHSSLPDLAQLVYTDAPIPFKEPGKKEEAVEWLIELLKSDGPLAASTIIELGEDQGFSRRTIYRARAVLGDKIQDTRDKKSPMNEWRLAEEMIHND